LAKKRDKITGMEITNQTQNIKKEPFLTVQELAARWKMKPWGIRTRISRRLPLPASFHFPGGQRRLFRLTDVEKWEEENTIYAPPPKAEPPTPRRRGRPTKREALEKRLATQAGGKV